MSDICGIEQKVPEITIGAAYGDALLAGIAVNALTPGDIKGMIKIRSVIQPDEKKHTAYEPYKVIFKELYTRNKDIMHTIR
jgi:xylulokinase